MTLRSKLLYSNYIGMVEPPQNFDLLLDAVDVVFLLQEVVMLVDLEGNLLGWFLDAPGEVDF